MEGFSIAAIAIALQCFCIKSIHSAFNLQPISAEKCDQNCFSVVAEILQVAHTFHSTGQVLVSQEWFSSVDQSYLTRFYRESGIPWLVYGKIQVAKNATKNTSLALSNKFTSPKFAHLHHSTFFFSSSSPKLLNAQRQQTWRKLLYLTFRQGMRIHYSELDGSSGSSRKAGLAATWNAFIQKDLFIVTFDLLQLLNSISSKQNNFKTHLVSFHNRKVHSIAKQTIWISCSHSSDYLTSSSTSNSSATTTEGLSVKHSQQLCIYSSRKGFTNLLGHIATCKDSSLTMHIDKFHQLLADHSVGSGQKFAPSANRQFAEHPSIDHEDHDILSSGIPRRNKIDPLSRKGFLYSSLVFITKKLPENNTTSSSTWGPFTIASWIGILAAYTVTAIVFALIKIITMNNLENSWYDCIFTQLISFMSEEKTTLSNQKREVITSISSCTIGIDVIDENGNYQAKHDVTPSSCSRNFLQVEHGSVPGVQFLETRRISVKSLSTPKQRCKVDQYTYRSSIFVEESQTTFVKIKYNQTRGKLSRTILYGTIRLVSFVLLAMYEGKLYNTITFPKSKLVATFDELISSDKYFIKVSSEAAKLENITARIKGNLTFEKGPPSLVATMKVGENMSTIGGAGGTSSDGKFVESVNILDCVNWVESAPDPNHACVGYEFELRNLHKAQKSDKILVRSKHRLLKFGSGGTASVVVTGSSTATSARLVSRRRGFTLFPGGLQISKWVLESGILQLWSIVENAFMESVINPNWKDPFKVFTIRDYLGLFVVYSMLLILATIMFLLEHIVSVLKKIAKTKKVRKFAKRVWAKIKTWSSFNCCGDGLVSSWKNIRCRTRNTSVLNKWRGRKYLNGWSAINESAV